MVAFIVYFWSQHLHGTSGWLEVMLFVAGLFCLAAEIFVLPGFGVLGLGGGLLVIASLVLASQSFVLPANDYQIMQMQWSLAGVVGAATGVAVMGYLLRHWLPATPVLRDVLLVPPAADAQLAADELQSLLGAEGTTTSRLAPAGKARIAGAVRDVTSDGELIEPGVRVRVADVRGGRLHVRPL
jgi:membrane-bound ClpP family serine protease